jgi:hypothetical protein
MFNINRASFENSTVCAMYIIIITDCKVDDWDKNFRRRILLTFSMSLGVVPSSH